MFMVYPHPVPGRSRPNRTCGLNCRIGARPTIWGIYPNSAVKPPAGGHEGVRRQVDLDGNGRADVIMPFGEWHWGSDSILFLMEGRAEDVTERLMTEI